MTAAGRPQLLPRLQEGPQVDGGEAWRHTASSQTTGASSWASTSSVTARRVTPMTDALTTLRAALHATPARRPVCNASRRNRWGRRVAECSFPAGHENSHRDIHSGRTWA